MNKPYYVVFFSILLSLNVDFLLENENGFKQRIINSEATIFNNIGKIYVLSF